MIAKNKNSPATLYLLNANHTNKVQQERKSARLTFNKKKSSRSISQYQKWNAGKDSNNGPFQPTSRTNSQIKRIVLSKNQFGIQSISIQRKLNSIIEIFGKANTRQYSQQTDQNKGKSQQRKSGQISMLSLKDNNDKSKQKYQKSRKISHVRTQSMLNHSDYQNNLEHVLSKINRKFKEYDQLSESWKLKNSFDENDSLLDDMLKAFKFMLNEVINHFTNQIRSNLQYFEDSLTTVSKQYEMQIGCLKEQISKKDRTTQIINNLMKTLNEKHTRGLICTRILQDIEKRGTNIEEYVKHSQTYDKILVLYEKQRQVNKYLNESKLFPQKLNQKEANSDDDIYQEERMDYVENDSNWNDNFNNRESIKGVLKYIHNHNQTKEKKQNLNMTASIGSIKHEKTSMKIENWKSFQNNDKCISNYKKIMSQR